jgi:hypothetical protein
VEKVFKAAAVSVPETTLHPFLMAVYVVESYQTFM